MWTLHVVAGTSSAKIVLRVCTCTSQVGEEGYMEEWKCFSADGIYNSF